MRLIIDIPEEVYKLGILGLYFDCYSMKLHDTILSGIPLEQMSDEIKDCLWKLSEGNTYLDITREEVENAILEIIDKYKS